MKKRQLALLCAASLITVALTGCRDQAANPLIPASAQQTISTSVQQAGEPFDFEVDPETFTLTIIKDGVRMPASIARPKTAVTDFVKEKDSVKWTYPGQVTVRIAKKNNYLDIHFDSIGAEQFQWPSVKAKSYVLPIGEGKIIPADDTNWRTFLDDQSYTWSESFSMDFFALKNDPFSIVYVVTNKFNDEVHFDTSSSLQLQFTHAFPSINKEKSYGFRLYVTGNDPEQIVLPYKSYIEESGKYVTLEDKSKDNPNIQKLYGAPQIYVWSESILTDHDVQWPKIRPLLSGPLGQWLVKLLAGTAEGSDEFAQVQKDIAKTNNMDAYQKRVVLSALNQGIKLKSFYSRAVFPNPGNGAQKLIDQGIDKLSEQKLYDLNKLLLKSVLQDAAANISTWGQADSTDLINEFHQSGIQKAWIGLPNWADGLNNPPMVEAANQAGYLIAPYDSYHSIQEQPDPSWNTAFFPDSSLFDKATIAKKDGSKIAGFLQRGRKLNPTLAMPSVKQRVEGILQDGIGYNSWFVDSDATGDVYDDYSPDHPTTQLQDMMARVDRFKYFAKDKHMVVGSEGGNDYASGVIAYAQGIESPVIAWGDPDMRDNKNSPFYIGGYYAASGIPERYGKSVPIKPLYEKIYNDPVYALPLYKLIYNDSIITTNHWEWGTYKIKGEEADKMLYGLLYNVPPLYHLNRLTWEQEKASILNYLTIWSPFHQQAVSQKMSKFAVLTEDRLVQSAQYGNDIKVIANFSEHEVKVDNEAIPAMSAVIYEGKQRTIFNAADNVKLLARK